MSPIIVNNVDCKYTEVADILKNHVPVETLLKQLPDVGRRLGINREAIQTLRSSIRAGNTVLDIIIEFLEAWRSQLSNIATIGNLVTALKAENLIDAANNLQIFAQSKQPGTTSTQIVYSNSDISCNQAPSNSISVDIHQQPTRIDISDPADIPTDCGESLSDRISEPVPQTLNNQGIRKIKIPKLFQQYPISTVMTVATIVGLVVSVVTLVIANPFAHKVHENDDVKSGFKENTGNTKDAFFSPTESVVAGIPAERKTVTDQKMFESYDVMLVYLKDIGPKLSSISLELTETYCNTWMVRLNELNEGPNDKMGYISGPFEKNTASSLIELLISYKIDIDVERSKKKLCSDTVIGTTVQCKSLSISEVGDWFLYDANLENC